MLNLVQRLIHSVLTIISGYLNVASLQGIISKKVKMLNVFKKPAIEPKLGNIYLNISQRADII